MKRIFLFIVTNLAVMLVLSVTLRILGVDRFLTAQGLNMPMLLAFSAVVGFAGALVSLFMSKPMAKWSTGAQVIDPSAPRNQTEAWLVGTVHQLADRAGIGRPEVAIYEGAPNAFATGAFKNASLVGHEVAHVANGDMVTLALIQGVVNTFVVFLARVVGYVVDRAVLRNDRSENDGGGTGIGYFVTVMVCEIVFGLAASVIVAWFSRQREFRADAGSAQLLGSNQPMIRALARLGGLQAGELPKSFASSGIAGSGGLGALFASHPPIETRIAALQKMLA